MQVRIPKYRSVPLQLRRLAEAVAEEGVHTKSYKIDGNAVALCFGLFNMKTFSKPDDWVLGLLFAAMFAEDNPGPMIDFGDFA